MKSGTVPCVEENTESQQKASHSTGMVDDMCIRIFSIHTLGRLELDSYDRP
jgi:hypothetical protein